MTTVEIPWPTSGGQSFVEFSMDPDTTYACHFRTPATLNPGAGSITLIEYDGQPSQHEGCLSLTAGALISPIPGEGTSFAGDISVSVSFLGADPPPSPGGRHKNKKAVLKVNTDYYLNVELTNPPDGGGFNRKLIFQQPRKST
jgi:hypothetical protein